MVYIYKFAICFIFGMLMAMNFPRISRFSLQGGMLTEWFQEKDLNNIERCHSIYC